MTNDEPLPPHLEQFVRQQLTAGRFQSEGDIIRAGLRLLEEPLSREDTITWLKQEIDKGVSSRPSQPVTKEYWDGLRERLAPSRILVMPPDRIIHKTGQATADIDELADYYRGEAGLAVALRFVDNAEQAFEQIAHMPKTGALLGLDELPYEDIRRWHIDGFDRLIILYRETADGIELIRVLHSSRNIASLLRDSPG